MTWDRDGFNINTASANKYNWRVKLLLQWENDSQYVHIKFLGVYNHFLN